jgi:hypothetical protein
LKSIDNFRDEQWLAQLLDFIWSNHFDDVEKVNEVRIKYGRKAKRRLGSIGLDRNNPTISVITINPIYRDADVPQHVIVATIVHEMTHYAHGFNSMHEQKQRHPHRGGVIRREFAERGLEDMYVNQKKWLDDNWLGILEKHFGAENIYKPRKLKAKPKSPWWFARF